MTGKLTEFASLIDEKINTHKFGKLLCSMQSPAGYMNYFGGITTKVVNDAHWKVIAKDAVEFAQLLLTTHIGQYVALFRFIAPLVARTMNARLRTIRLPDVAKKVFTFFDDLDLSVLKMEDVTQAKLFLDCEDLETWVDNCEDYTERVNMAVDAGIIRYNTNTDSYTSDAREFDDFIGYAQSSWPMTIQS